MTSAPRENRHRAPEPRDPVAGEPPPEAPRTSGARAWGWAVGLANPLVRLETFGWRRRPFPRLTVGAAFLAVAATVFLARSGFPPGRNVGYTAKLSEFVQGDFGFGRPQTPLGKARAFAALWVVNFEKGLFRLTTFLPWALLLRSVWRIRRSGLWDSLRATPLTRRDWVAGLVGPPLLLSAFALAVFLVGVVRPDFLARYATYPEPMREAYRKALVATIPFVGLEGMANGVLVSAATLHEALRTRRLSTVVARSLGWVLAIQVAHAFLLHGFYAIASRFEPGASYPAFLFYSHSFQLSATAAVKSAAGIAWLAWIARTFFARQQQEAESMG